MEEMNRRIESGEFGSPPDFNKINEAWADLLEIEMSKQGRNANYTSITGMWKQNGKVAFSGRVQEDITINAGTKILAFHGEPEEGTKQPDIRLVSVTYDN